MLKHSANNGQLLHEYLLNQINTLREEIEREPNNKLLNVNEIAYIDYLTQKYSIDPLVCDWENEKIHDDEKQIPANRLPPDVLFLHRISHNDPRTFPQNIIVYQVPFFGDKILLEYRPMTSNMSLPELSVSDNQLTFEIPGNVNNAEETKKTLERHKNSIRQQINNINADLANHNANIKVQANHFFRKRKETLLERAQLLESIGIPIKRIDNGQPDSIIPILKKKIIVQKPPSSGTDYVPDPAIDDATYQEILKMCHDLGVAMERRPSLYKDANGKIKCEEALRDVFLVPLSLQFESVTGETINNAGKTDILIRYQGKNAFVNECKFWGGDKIHQKTIDQLLGNLTWRDSKASIIYFVKQVNLKAVLDQIKEFTPNHPCFVKDAGNTEISWSNYHFHLPHDKNLNVKIAILVFHLI